MKRKVFLNGEKVVGLTFICDDGYHVSPSRKTRMAIFQCQCGKKFSAIIRSVVSGNTKSCGCFGVKSRSDRFKKHGFSKTKIYKIWCGIKTRCYNEKRYDYKFYGGRGIFLSDEFHDFSVFYEHVSSLNGFDSIEKQKLTIDRINNNISYEKGNLKWSTRKQQAQNRRSRSS